MVSRVTIDETYWNKSNRIEKRFDINPRLLLFSVTSLWHSTQEQKQIKVTKTELIDACQMWDLDDDLQSKIIDGLQWQKFIYKDDDGLFEICGNDTHIQNIENAKAKRSAAGKKAANTRWKKQKKDDAIVCDKDAIECESHNAACETHKTDAIECDTMRLDATVQDSTVQNSAEQFSTDQSKASQGRATQSIDTHMPQHTNVFLHSRVSNASQINVIQKYNELVRKYAPDSTKYFKGTSFGSGGSKLDFDFSREQEELDSLAKWEAYFLKAFKTEFLLTGKFCNLLWLIKFDNYLKVEAGTYEPREAPAKKNPKYGGNAEINWDAIDLSKEVLNG